MKQYDDSPRIVDMITSFGGKKPPSGKRKRNQTGADRAEIESRISSPEQRLAANGLRPTIARAGVLSALEKAAPSCLDASLIYRILSMQFDSLAQGSVYRALSDLWSAGLLVRTAGARGRAFYAIKPEAPREQYVTLRCDCGARLVFIENLALRKYLQLLAAEEGFLLDEEPVFNITTTCSKCRRLRKKTQRAIAGNRSPRVKPD